MMGGSCIPLQKKLGHPRTLFTQILELIATFYMEGNRGRGNRQRSPGCCKEKRGPASCDGYQPRSKKLLEGLFLKSLSCKRCSRAEVRSSLWNWHQDWPVQNEPLEQDASQGLERGVSCRQGQVATAEKVSTPLRQRTPACDEGDPLWHSVFCYKRLLLQVPILLRPPTLYHSFLWGHQVRDTLAQPHLWYPNNHFLILVSSDVALPWCKAFLCVLCHTDNADLQDTSVQDTSYDGPSLCVSASSQMEPDTPPNIFLLESSSFCVHYPPACCQDVVLG